jgi:hypothetical protein
MRQINGNSARRWLIAILCLIAFCSSTAIAAAATPPQQLWEAPLGGESGAEAGRLKGPAAVAADPTSGHIYVAEIGNSRISEFDAWGEFLKAWGWGVRDGAAELQTCGPQAVPPSAACLTGISGSGVGQFTGMGGGLAIDSSGNIFVGDGTNRRIQKFDPSAGPEGKEVRFLSMFGGEVNKGPNHPGNLCTATHIAEGDTCGIGTVGTGDGQLERLYYPGNYITIGPDGTIFLGDEKGRIQEFEPDGSFKSKFTLGGPLPGNVISSLVVDSAGNLYVTFLQRDNIYKFDSSGAPLATIPVELFVESPLALDALGNLYAVRENHPITGGPPVFQEVVEFGPSGTPILPPGEGFAAQNISSGGLTLLSIATNSVTAAGGTDIYVVSTGVGSGSVSSYGPPPDKWAPPKRPPSITAQYALSVDADGATVGAQINPRFWADTRYYVEWGTGPCSAGGCPERRPAPPGPELGAGIVNAAVNTKAILLAGLQPATTYHYRFVAQSTGSEGAEVRGVGGQVGLDGAEATFTTPAIPTLSPPDSCPNAQFRVGFSAHLSECRAYEMVSPVDKNGTDIVSLINLNSNPAALDQSAVSGEALTYTSSQGFGDTKGVPYVSQYIASRGASGWQSHAISPPQGLSLLGIGDRVEVEYRAFTADLCGSALRHTTDPPLVPAAVEGFANLYLRDNCPPGADAYTALTTSAPPNQDPQDFEPQVQGLAANGSCAVFYAGDKLTPEASSGLDGAHQVYESCGGPLRLISVLPNGIANSGGASAGTANQKTIGIRTGTTAAALSADGSRVYWTASEDGPEKLYVRINATQEQSKVSGGKCTEAQKACTIRVSETVSAAKAHFWNASADGSRSLFTIEDVVPIGSNGTGKLYEFDLATKKSLPIAAEVMGVLGASTDATRVYFVSKEVLTGANADGRSPALGKGNLYLFDAARSGPDRYRFLAILSVSDARTRANKELTPANVEPYKKVSRVSAGGETVAFMSNASLTGYDNVDSQSGKADAEIFAYDSTAKSGGGELHCISCNPTGQRPAGRLLRLEDEPSSWAAGLLSPFQSELYGSRALSDDGTRIFFDGYEALTPGDTNGKADVYQWTALSAGTCTEQSREYSQPNGGCLSLISSGGSATDSQFVDASPTGDDVFFTTDSSLVSQDTGLIDIYDARVGGGYPAQPGQPGACEGEACQGPSSAPNDRVPSSMTFQGAGNVRKATKRSCPKGKVRRKGRCVKKHKGGKKHRSNHRRAGR